MSSKNMRTAVEQAASKNGIIQDFLGSVDPRDCNGVINHLIWNHLVSTAQACTEWGVSRRAFRRLTRKYGIEPIYRGDNVVQECHRFLPSQLDIIPEEEIEKARKRCVRGKALAIYKRLPESARNAITWEEAVVTAEESVHWAA